MARFTDIVIDAVNPPRVAAFLTGASDHCAKRPQDTADIERNTAPLPKA